MSDKKFNVWVRKDQRGKWRPLIGQYENNRPIIGHGETSSSKSDREDEEPLPMTREEANKWVLLFDGEGKETMILEHGSPSPKN